MEIEKFIIQAPYLYHLTSEQNAKRIIKEGKLYSANALIDKTKAKSDQKVKYNKRFSHHTLLIDGTEVLLRDQRPISEKALSKCLTDSWSVADFIYHLNDRVFMWPSLDRLSRHFDRYKKEVPIIFRFLTKDMVQANAHVKFARLNTGATRANSHLGGKAPERGKSTFLNAKEYVLSPRTVAEVTFEKECIICGKFGVDFNPLGDFAKFL
jgi:hypothetical protein